MTKIPLDVAPWCCSLTLHETERKKLKNCITPWHCPMAPHYYEEERERNITMLLHF